MNAEEAARIAFEFLDELLLDDLYAVKVEDDEERERLLYVQHVLPESDELQILFGLESDDGSDDPDDPEVQDLAAKAIDALRVAHPEVFAHKVTWEVEA
jgi:hypothetical protein